MKNYITWNFFQGVVTLPTASKVKVESSDETASVLTNLNAPTQLEKAIPLPPNYDALLKEKIDTKKQDSTYRYEFH